MQTQLADFIRGTATGDEAEKILRSCVHCGFCTATCPTYQLLGDELDGPRGRIYLIKEVLEGQPVTEKTQQHLDRCLTCRSCETTCPSGVNYHRLLDIGRAEVEKRVTRSFGQRLLRGMLLLIMPRRTLFATLLAFGRIARPLLPAALRAKIPAAERSTSRPSIRHSRRMLMLEGCVQPALSPNINAATARVLDAIGISIDAAPASGCCGALRFHLHAQEAALDDMRRNIDAWWPALSGNNPRAESVIMTASGCGVQVKAYGELLAHDERYRKKAALVAERTRDISEILVDEETVLRKRLAAVNLDRSRGRIAFHAPCTLQHGQQIHGAVERLLTDAGYELVPVSDSHLCCGSAGTYSILEPKLSQQLRDNKLHALGAGHPELIVSANIGCLTHLQTGTSMPVKHWIELIDAALTNH